MTKAKRQAILAVILIAAIIVIDQWIKIYIKTHFVLHESYKVTSWFYLSFIENNGMAFGMQVGSKLLLTMFRIAAIGAFSWFLCDRIRKSAPWLFVVSFSMVIAGAIGNVIDCVFYGQWFTSSIGRVAQWADASVGLMPEHEWLQGRVVDMFYFPLIRFNWPDWVPRAGEMMQWGVTFPWPDWMPCSDEPFLFFKPVFNFADAAVSVGVGILMLLYFYGTYVEKKSSK